MTVWNDTTAIQRCRELADRARTAGEAAVGCVITRDGNLVAETEESVHRHTDPTAHAELLAVRIACSLLQTRHLPDCVLYSNVEPCHMCAYAIREAGIGRVVFVERIGLIGGMSPTEALLTKWSEEWRDPPVIEVVA